MSASVTVFSACLAHLVIDYSEFLLMLNTMNMDKFLAEDEMRELFEFADPDGSGGIDIGEFNTLFEAQEPLKRRNKKKVRPLPSRLPLRDCHF